MISIELILSPEEAANEEIWKKKAVVKSGIPLKEIHSIQPVRRSIDARGKNATIRLVVDIFTNENPAVQDQNIFRRLQNVSTVSL